MDSRKQICRNEGDGYPPLFMVANINVRLSLKHFVADFNVYSWCIAVCGQRVRMLKAKIGPVGHNSGYILNRKLNNCV